MERTYPLIPSAHWQICNVRDVALAHVRAMVHPAASGQSHIISSRDVTLLQISKALSKKFDPQGWDLATLPMPNFAFKLLLKTNLQKYAPILPKQRTIFLDNSKAKIELGLEFGTAENAVCEMAQSLIDCGVVVHPKQRRAAMTSQTAKPVISEKQPQLLKQAEQLEKQAQQEEQAEQPVKTEKIETEKTEVEYVKSATEPMQ